MENNVFNMDRDGSLPVRYVLVPSITQTGRDDLSNYYSIDAYIVAKAFIVEKKERIISHNNLHQINYKVLLPFYVNNYLKVQYAYGEKHELITDNIYDNYEEAKEYAKEINEQIFLNSFGSLSFEYIKTHGDELIKKRNQAYQKYDDIEQKIAEYTKKMQILDTSWGKNVEKNVLLKRYKIY